MDNEIKRPTAALINNEWFRSAQSVLDTNSLGRVLVAACEYVFAGDTRTALSPNEKIVFAMVRPSLDSDVQKYIERCARNAANARSNSQRVAASGSQSQPVGANTTTTSTTTPTTTSSSFSPEAERDREVVDKWLIFGYLWATGTKAVKEELNAFWSYYESLGWKNNKGAAIVSRLACARMWHRQFETETAPNGAETWFAACKSCPVPDYNIWLCYAGAERTEAGVVVRLRCKEDFCARLMDAVPTLKKTLQGAWKVQDLQFECLS